MSVITGIKAKDGYLFFIDDLTAGSRNNGGIVKLSEYCGALILTSGADQLNRMQKVLARCIAGNIDNKDDLSDDLIEKLVRILKTEFQNDPSYKTMPLTFLLLVVGVNRKQENGLEHVYIRNRVSDRIKKNGSMEYETVFDIEPAIPAGNIFYGEANMIEYLAQQISSPGQPIDIIKLLACFSVIEVNTKENISLDGIKMACLSAENGFTRIESDEVSSLIKKARAVNPLLEQGLNSFMSSIE